MAELVIRFCHCAGKCANNGDRVVALNYHRQLDWIEQWFTSPPTQYRLYGRRVIADNRQ